MSNILHCDLNNFFASVEEIKNPSLKKVPMAVAGDPKLRAGIILAKNNLAKSYGIVTAETVYSAKNKCRNLVCVPSDMERYIKYSKLARQIYLKYTDQVEPFGIDEAWLDITGSIKLFGTPENIAFKIKEEIKSKLGLTISVGVSFNKVFAKLGSDMKKPDAITVITKENFKAKIYSLAVEELIYVGKRAKDILNKRGIYTIGQLANFDKTTLIKILGKQGNVLHCFANGLDDTKVANYYDEKLPKSISRGRTFVNDLDNIVSMEKTIKVIVDEIAKELRNNKLKCNIVTVKLKDNTFITHSKQKQVRLKDSYKDILEVVIKITEEMLEEKKQIRAITISISSFNTNKETRQLSLFDIDDNKTNIKKEEINSLLDNLNNNFGNNIIKYGSLVSSKMKNKNTKE